jgi:hypothetical protein
MRAAGNAPTKSKTRDHPGFQLIYVEASRRRRIPRGRPKIIQNENCCTRAFLLDKFFIGIYYFNASRNDAKAKSEYIEKGGLNKYGTF